MRIRRERGDQHRMRRLSLIEQQRNHFLETVTTLARTVEMHNQYTGDHIKRVTEYAMLLGNDMKLSPQELYQLQVGTPLHDIGKIGIDDAILRKPGKLTEGEFEAMKTHTIKGVNMLESIQDMGNMIAIVRHHHERWDGRDYPDCLEGEDIPLNAQHCRRRRHLRCHDLGPACQCAPSVRTKPSAN